MSSSHRNAYANELGERKGGARRVTLPGASLAPKFRSYPAPWASAEFLFYYVCVGLALFRMCGETYYISTEQHPNYERYARRLQEGWLFGRKVDNSDLQFSLFRNNYPLLLCAMAGYLGLSHAARRFLVPKSTTKQLSEPLYRTYFFLAFSLCFLTFLFGASVLKIVAIVSANYVIAKALGGWKWSPAVTWTINLLVLFANEVYHGYKFRDLDERLAGLDIYNGIARWDSLTERARVAQPCKAQDYNYVYYLAYLLYTPLYLAGPIITYNSFISQLRRPPREITIKRTLIYGARLLICIAVMEIILHFFYVVAISKEKVWDGYTPFQISMVGYWNLKIIWLKLLIIWRFFRFWAMADGIESPENMVRCMSNNYSAQSFWRSWHRSYNRWIIRYIYIPLGGAKYAKYNIWVIFTFVALWHDLSLNLIAWGWLICLFIMPEMFCTAYFGRPKFRRWKYYRHFAAFGGVLNIMLMMGANLVGFAVGIDGVKDIVTQILTPSGAVFILCTVVTLFSAVQVMFAIRESESRAAADLRC